MKIVLLFFILFSSNFASIQLVAETSYLSSDIKYKKARVLQRKTLKKMEIVYDIYNKYEGEGCILPFSARNKIESILKDILSTPNLKEYDQSVAWNNYGYLYWCDKNYQSAISAYEKVINNPKVTYPIRNLAIQSLGKLYLQTNKPHLGRDYMLEYINISGTVKPEDFANLSFAYLELDQIEYSYQSAKRAVAFADLEFIPLSKTNQKNMANIAVYYLTPICKDYLSDDKADISKNELNNCINNTWKNEILIEKDVLGILISEGNFIEYNDPSDSGNCILCEILARSLIGAIEQYPEAKARVDRENAIRKKAYNDARRRCNSSVAISC
tara:strand:+ start:140 stop:1123 length:984 start_codon:yes stop_codon:yes gene_type:complete